ncbi:hypothetical protein GCM10022222_32580 [Amycolatopsis ultiminotia]|uniref:AB hydrolase-1 domain-containing protein n=1 Tax=Amycolatopsis ultiminotia TaxID=543629 RepID=A0ABP6W7R8_9PSEU
MATTSNGMHYQELGTGERALVLLPGFGCSTEAWAEVAPLLEGYRTILMDLPGHAGSAGAAADGNLHHLGETVVEACREIGLTKFALAGTSLGGAICVRIALDHPAETTAVVGVMPWNAGGTHAGDQVIEGFLSAYGDRETIAAGVLGISRKSEKTTDLPRTMATVTEQMWKGWLGEGAYTSMAEQLPELQVPVCYLIGGKDVVVDQEAQIADIRRIPGGRLVLLADAGHLACYEIPETIAKEINDFLGARPAALS